MDADTGYRGQGTGDRSRGSSSRPVCRRHSTAQRGITLVEMLVAMAITLVMMAAVVTLFASVSDSVRNRRSTIELSGQLRQVRNMLQADLANATCPGLTWRRPESNQGYVEIIEGPYREGNASRLVDGLQATDPLNPEIDHTTSLLPASNVDFTKVSGQERWVSDGGGLGDYDDTLMLTCRNEHEPFVGRVPAPESSGSGPPWGSKSETSPLAEVVWFAVENPVGDANGDGVDDTGHFFGEPGLRTIYRRALLIAPWLDPYADTALGSRPGVVLDYPALPSNMSVEQALAELIAFQDQYDLSVRMERYVAADGTTRTRFVANTLGDLTKRENRYEHHFFNPSLSTPDRQYPYAALSAGSGYNDGAEVAFVPAKYGGFGGPTTVAKGEANVDSNHGHSVLSYTVTTLGAGYQSRPLTYVDDNSTTVATARAMLNDDGQVVRVVRGLVPLWGARRGEDVMLTGALAFDLRVYDPGAPVFGVVQNVGGTQTAITAELKPGDPGWMLAYLNADNMMNDGSGAIGNGRTQYPFSGQGAYVDLGYGVDTRTGGLGRLWDPVYNATIAAAPTWYFHWAPLRDVYGNELAPGYANFDTWSTHYENDGLNEDGDSVDASGYWLGNLSGVVPQIDEGTNGLDDLSGYDDVGAGTYVSDRRLGADDVGERETAPPYDRPLRAVQVTVRAYEPDSRQIRQATVRQQMMPE